MTDDPALREGIVAVMAAMAERGLNRGTSGQAACRPTG
jgi:hypothetical protein